MKVLNGYSYLIEIPVFLGSLWLSFMAIGNTPSWIMDVFGEAEYG